MKFDGTPEHWRTTTLGDIAVDAGLVGGPFGSSLGRKDYVEDGIPVIRGANIAGEGKFDSSDLVFVTEEKVQNELRRNTAVPGDIILTQRGTLGQVGVVPQDSYPTWVISQSQERLRVDQAKANSNFIYFALRSPALIDEIERRAITTGVPHINLGITRELPIPLPSLNEQERIGWVLGSLDDKIENDQRLIKTLEEIAISLFKARFVDFLGYEALVESDPIPRGWDLCQLSQVATVLTRGRAPAYVDKGGILVVNQKCVRFGRVDFGFARRHDEQARSSEDRRLQPGDVLINSTGVGTLGRVSQVRWLPEPATVDSHVTMIRAAEADMEQDYLALSLMSRQGDLERMGHGSTGQTELTRSRLAEMPIVVPPREEQRTLSRFYSPIREQIGTLERQVVTLSEIRDALLPRLISGQIRIPPERQSAPEGA